MRILLVEDEHGIARAIKKGLEQENYAVDVAYDGAGGYDLAISEEYDCVVLDVMLPEMNGFEIAQKLRSENIHVPILMLTARGELGDKVKGLEVGADDYLVKPFAFEELLARIRALIRRPNKVLKNQIVAGDITINSNSYEVKRAGKSINLSRKEYSLLEYLVRNVNVVLSKEKIISHVWDYDADILNNTVEVYIRNLRKKLAKPDIIKTVRGFGYKLTP